jgi:hypothetical protein
MNSERFRDPDPPVVGEVERQAVCQRARRIRRQQRLRLILPTAVVAAAVVGVAIPLAGLHSAPGSLHPAIFNNSPTGASTCPGHDGRSEYDRDGVRFEYPSCWMAASYEEETSFSISLVDLSNQTMHAPCTTTTSTPGRALPGGPQKITICRLPITSLAPHGILVRWSSNGSPQFHLDQEPGAPLTVGGRSAREQIRGRSTLTSTFCGSIGADESISVEVAETESDDYYDMTACLRGPDTAAAVAQVRAMLASTTFASQ